MDLPFGARVLGAAIFAGCYLAARWRLRPTGGQHLAALFAGLCVAAYDWVGEVVLYRLGVWEYQGGIQAIRLGSFTLDLLHVPLEMPLGFILAGMAACFALAIPDRLRQRGSQGRIARAGPVSCCVGLVIGTALLGALIDSTYNPWSGSVAYRQPYGTVMAHIVPFWAGGAVLLMAVYALALKLLPGAGSPFAASKRTEE